MPDDNYIVIDCSSIMRPLGGWRTFCRVYVLLYSNALLLFLMWARVCPPQHEQVKVYCTAQGKWSQQQLTPESASPAFFSVQKMCSLSSFTENIPSCQIISLVTFFKKKNLFNALLHVSNLVGSVLTYFVKCWCNRFGFLKSFTTTDSEQELNGPAMGQRNKL